MSRSQNAVELCALLVDETYGELTSRIYTILLRKGRLTVSAISHHTRLKPREVRHGLVVLIQQNLVYHISEDGLAHFEANDDAAYALVRSGKIMDLVETRYGILAKDVVQNLFLLGHTKVSDLADAYASQQQKPAINGHSNGSQSNGVNGHANANALFAGQLDRILVEFLEHGLVEPVVEAMFRSPADMLSKITADVYKEMGGAPKTGKDKEKAEQKVWDRMQNQKSEGVEWRSKILKRPSNGVPTNGVNGSSKRRRLPHSGSSVNGDHTYEDDGTRLDPNLVIRINHKKCAVLLRNSQLVGAVRNRIGIITSQVYEQFLRCLEKEVPDCQHGKMEDDHTPYVSTKDIAMSLDKSINVASGIGKSGSKLKSTESKSVLGSPEANKKRKSEELDTVVEDQSDDENGTLANGKAVSHDNGQESDDPFADAPPVKPTKRQKVTFQDSLPKRDDYQSRDDQIYHVKEHLLILEHDKYGFVQKAGIEGSGNWSINFEKVIQNLREHEVDKLILELFGETGHRLTRMLRKLGKLDEKAFKDLALMKQKDVRTKLAEMQLSGFVDIQEVPRDATRSTSNARVIFLWFFDDARCSSLVLDHTYKAMTRLLQRLAVERRRTKDVLVLTQRSDVRDKPPEDYLTPLQLNELNAFRDREEMLLGQLGRLDEIVSIFRDY